MWKLLGQSEAVEDLVELHQQDPRQARRVRAAIIAFGRPGEGDIKALRGRSDEVRLRVGDWRVIIERDAGSPGVAVVSRVRLRRGAYE